MPSNVLVTGGAGYIGSHTAKELARAGYNVFIYDNLSRGHRWAVRWGPLIEGDVHDTERLTRAMDENRIEAVLHFAALIAVGESMQVPEVYFHNNVVGSLSLLNAMRTAGVRKIVFSSTAGVYGIPEIIPIEESSPTIPLSAYGDSKLMVEKILHWEGVCHGLKHVVLRYFNAAGGDPDGETGEDHYPETHLIPCLLQAAQGTREAAPLFGDDYPTPDGTCIRDYVHVTDLAEAHVKALHYLERGGANTTLNLGTGHGYSVKEILTAAEKVIGHPVPVVQQPRRPGDPPLLVAAAGRAQEVLGWQPTRSSLDNILGTAWRWQEHHAALAKV